MVSTYTVMVVCVVGQSDWQPASVVVAMAVSTAPVQRRLFHSDALRQGLVPRPAALVPLLRRPQDRRARNEHRQALGRRSVALATYLLLTCVLC